VGDGDTIGAVACHVPAGERGGAEGKMVAICSSPVPLEMRLENTKQNKENLSNDLQR
jgi:hypothetical protein